MLILLKEICHDLFPKAAFREQSVIASFYSCFTSNER